MGLPTVDIPFQNGNIGLVDIPEDGIFGVVASMATNALLPYGTCASVRSMTDVAQLGITDNVTDHFLYKFLQEFFSEAGDGTKIWIMPIARTEKMSDQFIPNAVTGIVPVQTMCDTANGEIRGIFTQWNPDTSVTLTSEDGLDEDVWATISAAQAFCKNYTETKKSPVWVVTEGYNFTGIHADLPDLGEMDNNRVQVVLGNTEKRTGATAAKGVSLGAYAGRVARIGVAVNPGRKKSGALYDTQIFIKDTPVKQYDIESLHDKRYVTFRSHLKTSGYFITDCPMATAATDDYGKLTRRRVIDKAYVLAYQVVSDEILEDFNLTASGTIDPIYAKQIEGNVISAIYTGMTLQNELSADLTNATDKGCVCSISTTYPTGTTGKIQFNSLQVKTRGYAEMIEVPIGYVPFNS